MKVSYIGHWGDDLAPLEAARMSTGNPTGVDVTRDIRLRQYLWDNEHHSPFEFGELVVEVECPIFVARQWMRHRTFSYNEFSGRYAEMPMAFWSPDEFRGQANKNKQAGDEALSKDQQTRAAFEYATAVAAAYDAYEQLLKLGVCREQARAVLPVATMTKFRVKGNLRNWIHFLRLRLHPHAQKEIRDLAASVARIVKHHWPLTYTAARLPDLWDNQEPEEREPVQPVPSETSSGAALDAGVQLSGVRQVESRSADGVRQGDVCCLQEEGHQ